MSDKVHLDRAHLHAQLRLMLRIRRFEARCVELYQAQKIRGFLHLYDGEEAVAVGVAAALTPGRDAAVATYREHGQALAWGVPMAPLMAEMLGKVEGCCRGRGGSMHLFSRAHRFYGGNAIVGGGLPLAAGIAMADKALRPGAITACFFGEGAVAEGVFHETMGLAALWKLPVLFVCENNLYAMGVPLEDSEVETEIWRKAQAWRMPTEQVDGMDPIAVEAAARRAVAAMREGGGPHFLEARTYRFRAHSMFDTQAYRSRDEIEAWRQRDPIERLRAWMLAHRHLSEADAAAMEAEVTAELDAAVAWAEAGTLEPLDALERHVLMDRVVQEDEDPSAPRPAPPVRAAVAAAAPLRMTYREACKHAIRDALTAEPRAFLVGEDVGKYGGCYAVSKGLLEEFGPARIVDAPLAENGFTGICIGAALAGLRPILEIMTCNFSLLALDQIMNNAATLPHMSGGQYAVPLVIRMATGGGRQLAAQHSHSLEGWFAHIPGLKVAVPGTVEDARWMLATAMADPNPVLIFEHIVLYNADAELDPAVTAVDLERAKVRRPGRDVTLVTYGNSLPKCLTAAEALARDDGIEAEVIDLRMLRPLDTATVAASVARTRRIVIVDEGWKSGSISAEVAARLAEDQLYELDAPIRRVCSREVPVPYAAHMEEAALPSITDIVAAVRGVVPPLRRS